MSVAHTYISNDDVIVIFSNVHLENRRDLNACLNQTQVMVIKIIYNINANDHLINPNNSGQTICILPIKVCEIFDLNIYLKLEYISNMSLTYW